MRVHKFTFAALAVAMSLALTACDDGDVKGKAGPSPASSVSAPAHDAGSGGSEQGGAKNSAEKSPGGQSTNAKSAEGLQPGDALAAHNFRLRMDGVPVEYLQEVSGLEDQKVTLVRGVTHSPEVDRWIDDAIAGREGRLKDVAVEMLDYQDNTVKQYQLRGAFVERVTYSDPPGQDSLTVRFFDLVIQ
ncbi:phage tail protein [Streptomyces sp. NPDC007164]|uniref:phage tail protein n=1 Tax=Streptomyces sp. NPDC007164 TaxID=3156918 RepID=UPI0033C6B361